MPGFDRSYADEPFRSLCESYPGKSVYPSKDFRVEWGPVFHRGRLDGSARVLVVGQDPAQHETIARRILVGEAGHRIQGFLAKLGIDRSYAMVNTFLYSVFGQGGGNRHRNDAKIAAYRNRWLKALLAPGKIDAVVALGSLAESAWQQWTGSADGSGPQPPFVRITHPTQPESAGGSAARHAAAIARMLANWNDALDRLHPLPHPDRSVPLRRYGTAFKAGEKVPIPAEDLPAGTPDWMRLDDGWADRPGTGLTKRRTIAVTVPRAAL
ncbi:MAG TPA: uracil-DNA glycosylase family protein [Gaiellaceae bacterium]|nr:uracil-DNA glycosylase family protein [Gaiellaceae bacterium]